MPRAHWPRTFTFRTSGDRESRRLLLNELRGPWREPFRTNLPEVVSEPYGRSACWASGRMYPYLTGLPEPRQRHPVALRYLGAVQAATPSATDKSACHRVLEIGECARLVAGDVAFEALLELRFSVAETRTTLNLKQTFAYEQLRLPPIGPRN